MINTHTPVMINEVLSYIPSNKPINVIDATFGGGGYSKAILDKFKVNYLLAIDRDPISDLFSKDIKVNYQNFNLYNDKFSNIDKIVKNSRSPKKKFDIILYDLGISSNQIDNSERGFSFQKDGPLDMNMGLSKIKAFDIINNFEESDLAKIFFKFGEERYSRIIAKEIVKNRQVEFIDSTIKLSNIIKKSLSYKKLNKRKTHPATKTFQALRIFVNDELNELKKSLEKSIELLSKDGLILIVSFHSLEDRIVKDFINHNSGKRWRSSRHFPELPDQMETHLKIITKKPIVPSDFEIKKNPRSRSAKLRVAQKK